MKKFVKWIIFVLIVAVIGVVYYNKKNEGVTVGTVEAVKGNIEQYLEETAQVKSKSKQTVYIEGAGKITDVNFEVGDSVKEGDILLSLDKTDLELQLKDAQAGIEQSKAQLKGTELINYANEIELAKVAVTQAENDYEGAKRNFEKSEELYLSNALSKEEYDKSKDSYESAVNALETSNLRLKDVEKGAPEYLKNSYKAQLERAVINRDTIIKSIEKQEVRSPINGVIIEKLVEKNSLGTPSMAAFVIGDIDDLELEADILADDINKIKIGNEVEISGKAVDDKILKGQIAKIAPAAKIVTSTLGVNQRRVPVTIKILDKTDLLKPEYSVDIKIITNTKNDVIILPDTSVFDYQGQSTVFIVKEGRAILQKVTKGIENRDFIEIIDGLKEGDIILEKPDNTITENMIVKYEEKSPE